MYSKGARHECVADIGYLDCAMTSSLELVVLCNEIIGWLKRYLRKLEISKRRESNVPQ